MTEGVVDKEKLFTLLFHKITAKMAFRGYSIGFFKKKFDFE